MKKYKITEYSNEKRIFLIDANSKEEAEEIVLGCDPNPDKIEYSNTKFEIEEK